MPKTDPRQDGVKKTIVLLDAHAIIHRAYHALPEFTSSKGEPTGALYGLATMIMRIATDFKPDYIVACYDLPGKTFRHEAYKEYKALRAKADDALIEQLKKSRQIFEAFNIPTYDCPGFEADDLLGTIAHILKDSDVKIIIASGDMDTMQLVDGTRVQVYTLKKGINDTVLYDEEKVVERFGFAPKFLPDYKGLRGDPSDNIKGVKGIGEKTATSLIVKFGNVEEIYKELKVESGKFKEIGITDRIIKLLKDNEQDALFSKTLATIRRDAPINFILPEKTFWENIDEQKITQAFTLFEFRSLFTRLKSFFGRSGAQEEGFRAGLVEPAKASLWATRGPEKTLLPGPQEEKLLEASIALWLINSELTNPSLEDVLNFANTSSLDEAHKYLLGKLKEDKLDQVYEEIEKPIIPTVLDMRKRGILIDPKYFKELSEEYHTILDGLTKKIYKMAGTEFNINSPKQLGEILFGKLNIKLPGKSPKKNQSGGFSTKFSVLEELEEENEIVREILAYRELQKLLSTYIDVIPSMVAGDGRLHATFLQNGSTTGRFSSQNPGLQNLPIKTELGRRIRKGFIAGPGHKLVAFDYSQIELRVVAMLSGDKRMIEIFREGRDIHAGVASFVFGVPTDSVTAEMRRQAKVINFGIIYGMGVNALRKNLGGSRDEAQKFYDNYFRQFSGVHEYLEEVKAKAMKDLRTETLFGRIRYFPNAKSRIPFLKNMALRTATNAPVQGTAADIIKLAIRYAEEDLKNAGLRDKAHLVLQIHDELVYEVENEALEQARAIITKAMEGVLSRSYLKYKTDVPLTVNSGFGENFDEVK